MMVQANEVEAELGEPASLLLDVLAVRSEQCPRGQISAPEARRRTVGEDQPLAISPEQATLAGWLFSRVQKREINRRDVPGRDRPIQHSGWPTPRIVEPK